MTISKQAQKDREEVKSRYPKELNIDAFFQWKFFYKKYSIKRTTPDMGWVTKVLIDKLK